MALIKKSFLIDGLGRFDLAYVYIHFVGEVSSLFVALSVIKDLLSIFGFLVLHYVWTNLDKNHSLCIDKWFVKRWFVK